MINLEYSVAGQLISATSVPQYLVADTVGIYRVVFTFDSDWSDLGEKTAVFRNPSVIDVELRDVPVEFPLDENNSALIPGAILDPGKLFIGVYGVNGTQQMPTIWAPPMQVVPGASPGVDAPDDPAIGTAVRTAPQTLTEAEKAQARENIGAIGGVEGDEGNVVVIGSNNNIVDSGKSFADIYDSAMIHKTASGAVATFEDGADDVPIKQMSVQIQPIQAGSGDPSPSNVRAISGRTGANLIRTGKNIGTLKGIGVYNPTTGEANPSASSTYAYSEKIKVVSGETLYLSFGFECTQRLVYKWDAGGNYIGYEAQNGAVTSSTYTIPSGVTYIAVVPRQANSTSSLDSFPKFQVVRLNASTFVPYNGTTYTIEFPSEAGTVYGGELTVNEDGTGVLTVDRKGITLTKDSDWSMLSAGKFFVNNCTNDAVTGSRLAEYISNLYPFAGNGQTNSSNVSTDKRFYGQLSQNRIWVYDSDFTTLEAWETELATTPLTCVYPIATPIVYQIIAEQVTTLLGLNNIWADTGDISVTYRADPTLATEEQAKAIKQSIAPVEKGYTASQPYEVNDLVYVGDTLYIVTSAIASGATMTPNTNISATMLNAVIKSLR